LLHVIGLDSPMMSEKYFKMYWKKRYTLFCGQSFKPDVHLFVNGGSKHKVAAAPAAVLARCGCAARGLEKIPERWFLYEGEKAYSTRTRHVRNVHV
jgi:hypothetical protein